MTYMNAKIIKLDTHI